MSLLVSLRPSLGPALVVGGGSVAARKVRGLLDAGFQVRVVAPAVCEAVRSAPASIADRPFRPSDLDGVALAFACTNDRTVNAEVGRLCRDASILVNVADAPIESTFHSLAVLSSGDVSIGVSTNGTDPPGAARIRDHIARVLQEVQEERP